MPGPDRLMDVIQKTLEKQALLQQEAAMSVIKNQTQQQILDGQLKLGLARGMSEAQSEAEELNGQAEVAANQPVAPFALNLGSAISETRVNPKEPLQAVNPAQLSETLAALTQGLPQAGGELVSRASTTSLEPERIGQQGFVMVPRMSEQTTRTPNQLTAADLLAARQRQFQHADQMSLERFKAQRVAQSQQLSDALAVRKSLLDTAEVARRDGLSVDESAALQEAVRIGDRDAIGRLTAGRKTLEDKANEALIRLRDAETKAASAKATRQGFDLTPAQLEADKKFGEFVGGMTANGGFERAETNLNVLRRVRDELAANKDAIFGRTGPALATLGPLRGIFNPESQNAKDLVASVVRQSARQILGAQYTAAEGENLVSETYNVMLPEKFNVERLDQFIDMAETQIQNNRNRVEYYDANGTISGFKESTKRRVKEKDAPASAPPSVRDLSTGDLRKQIELLRGQR